MVKRTIIHWFSEFKDLYSGKNIYFYLLAVAIDSEGIVENNS